MLSYHILNDSMVISCNGKYYNINKGDQRFSIVLELIKAGRLDEVPGQLELVINDKDISINDGSVLIDGEPVPDALTDKLLQFKKENIPFDYLVQFVRKLRKNPSFNSRQSLYKFIEHNGHPITTEGNFIAYRGITDDYKDVHTKTMDNRPGSVVSVPRNAVDDNPNNTCSHGLHVACYSYAKDFGEVLVEVEVNPEHVVCVPTDYDGTKMRVCQFKVVQEVKQMNTKILEKSSYAPSISLDLDSEYSTAEELAEDRGYHLKLATSSFVDSAYYILEDNALCVTLQGKEYTIALDSITNWYYVLQRWEAAKSSGAYFNKYLRKLVN